MIAPHCPPLHRHLRRQVDQGRENEVVRLGIQQKTLFEVSHAPPGLSLVITNAVQSAIQTAISRGDSKAERRQEDPANMRDSVVGIPRTAVDDAIRLHHIDEGVSYSLYLLHPNSKARYQYIHENPVDTDGEDGAAGTHGTNQDGRKHAFPGDCAYVGWVGKRERYAWLDLGAYLSSGWGPRNRALGVVSPSTLPNLAAAAAALAAGRGRNDAWLYPQLAALVHRSASQLMVPPLLFTPAGLLGRDLLPLPSSSVPARWSEYVVKSREPDGWRREEVVVLLFLVCDASPCPSNEMQAWAGLEELLREPESGTTRSNVGSLMPQVTVEREEVLLWESPLLATGLQQSVQSTRGGPFAASGSMSLLAPELRHWLRLFLDGPAKVRRSGGGDGNGGEDASDGAGVRVVPLFVISLDAETPVLLDHSARSTAFPDMVVSVRSRDGVAFDSTFHCGGRNVMLGGGVVGSGVKDGEGSDGRATTERDGGENMDGGLLRDTVASLAQVIWGAPPRTLSWDPLTDSLGTDYLWATGASMHTPLSPHSSLTFTERDSYLRTRILRRVDAAVGAARDVLEQAAAVEPRLAHVLYGGDHARAAEHWQGVQDNLGKCLDELAVHHHESAMRFSRALESHVAGLGAALSAGYGNQVFPTLCHCKTADGEVDIRTGGSVAGDGGSEKLALFMDRACYALFGVAALCVAWAAWRSLCRRRSGRSAGGWRKHKFS